MITSLYTALLALIFIALSVNVVRSRQMFKVALSDGNKDVMKQRIRAQGNFAEYTPLFLIMLGVAEYNRLPGYAIHILGVLFITGRILHAYSLLLDEKYNNGKLVNGGRYRVRGMVFTLASIGMLVTILIIQYFL